MAESADEGHNTQADDDLLATGEACDVRFAHWSGQGHAKQTWNSLEAKVYAAFLARFQHLAMKRQLREPQWRNLEAGIWEIKVKKHERAACFQHKNTWWITHFFRTSHKPKRVAREIERAKTAKAEHLQGEGENDS